MARKDLQPYPVNVTLTITQEDIDFGIARDSYSCAIAHAVYRTFPDAVRVRVTRSHVSWSDTATDERYVYPTPPKADKAVIRPFDEGGEVHPTSFRLSGGQFRQVDHHHTREAREYARKLKREQPEKYARNHLHHGSREFDRYVPERKDL